MNKQLLQEIVNNTSSKGLIPKLSFKYKEIFDEIVLFQRQNNMAPIEVVYCILHELSKKPDCPKLCDKCNNNVTFISLQDGFRKYCRSCTLHNNGATPSKNPMYKEECRNKMTITKRNNFKTSGIIQEICREKNFELISEYSGAYKEITVKCTICGKTKTLVWTHFQQSNSKCCN